jgi:hypothetical protein
MGLQVDGDQLADFGVYLGMEARVTLPTIWGLGRDEGMSTDGFTGALAPLGEFIAANGTPLVNDAFEAMRDKLCNLGDALISVAKTYGYVDESNKSVLERTANPYREDFDRYLPKSQIGN